MPKAKTVTKAAAGMNQKDVQVEAHAAVQRAAESAARLGPGKRRVPIGGTD